MTIELQSVSSASNDKFTAMLVNAILQDDHSAAKMAQDVIKTRGSMTNVPEYQAGVNRITSGLESLGVQMRAAGDKGIA
jgi:hypothetical protein